MYPHFTLLLLCLCFFCSAPQKKLPAPERNFLIVSADIRDQLRQIDQTTYTRSRTSGLFATMDAPSDALCAMMWEKTKFDKNKVLEFVAEDQYKSFRYSSPRSIKGLIAGCHNFFKLNDKEPFRSFRTVRQLYSGYTFDCYSVGFLQPYMMHNEIGCNQLTMVDIDWRILEGHQNLLASFEANQLLTVTDSSLSHINLPWVAQLGYRIPPHKMLAERKATLSELCPEEQLEDCKAQLQAYQVRKLPPSTVRLNLSPLHDIDFNPVDNRSLRVVFLSNAIENIYTSQQEFDALLTRTRETSRPGHITIFIHQAGSRRSFGLYEYQTVKGKDRIRTICKDDYPETRLDRTQEFYLTYFDAISERHTAPACAALYEKINRR